MSRTVCNRTSAAFPLVPLGLSSVRVKLNFINIILISLAVLSCRPAPRVVITTKQGNEVKVNVEIADSPAKRELGLQYRRELREN